MKCKIIDSKYHFMTLFDDETGTYIRSGIIKKGRDTGEDPFMASFPHLIDVGVMGHCIHGKTGLCRKAGIGCYQNGAVTEKPNMTTDMFFGHHADEFLYMIGYVIGRIILCAAGFAAGYIGINVLIGVWRWFSGVFL